MSQIFDASSGSITINKHHPALTKCVINNTKQVPLVPAMIMTAALLVIAMELKKCQNRHPQNQTFQLFFTMRHSMLPITT